MSNWVESPNGRRFKLAALGGKFPRSIQGGSELYPFLLWKQITHHMAHDAHKIPIPFRTGVFAPHSPQIPESLNPWGHGLHVTPLHSSFTKSRVPIPSFWVQIYLLPSFEFTVHEFTGSQFTFHVRRLPFTVYTCSVHHHWPFNLHC